MRQDTGRLFNGEMSLYELQMLVSGQNKIAKAQSGDKSPDYKGPSKWSEEQWENNEAEVQRVTQQIEAKKDK